MSICKYLQENLFEPLKKHEKDKKSISINNICIKQKNNKLMASKIASVAKEKFNRHFPMNEQCHFSNNQKICPFFEEKI